MKKIIIGILLIIIGLSLFSYSLFLIWKRNSPVSYKTSRIALEKIEATNKTYPKIIQIKSLNIDLPVIPVKIIDGKWENPENAVGYWENSPIPGDEGNSVFYGHNWNSVFGQLKNIKKEDQIKIKLSDGTIRNFNVVSTSTISSDQTHIISNTDDTRLTIYTCSGFLDSKRFVVVAIPE